MIDLTLIEEYALTKNILQGKEYVVVFSDSSKEEILKIHCYGSMKHLKCMLPKFIYNSLTYNLISIQDFENKKGDICITPTSVEIGNFDTDEIFFKSAIKNLWTFGFEFSEETISKVIVTLKDRPLNELSYTWLAERDPKHGISFHYRGEYSLNINLNDLEMYKICFKSDQRIFKFHAPTNMSLMSKKISVFKNGNMGYHEHFGRQIFYSYTCLPIKKGSIHFEVDKPVLLNGLLSDSPLLKMIQTDNVWDFFKEHSVDETLPIPIMKQNQFHAFGTELKEFKIGTKWLFDSENQSFTIWKCKNAEKDLGVKKMPSFLHNLSWNYWINNKKQNTGLHYDSHEGGFLTVVTGEKKVILIPAVYRSHLPLQENRCNIFAWNYVDNKVYHPILKNIPIYVASLKKGDTLYIPHNWFHEVVSEEKTIALSAWKIYPELHSDDKKKAITQRGLLNENEYNYFVNNSTL